MQGKNQDYRAIVPGRIHPNGVTRAKTMATNLAKLPRVAILNRHPKKPPIAKAKEMSILLAGVLFAAVLLALDLMTAPKYSESARTANLKEGRLADLFGTHPPMAKRITILRGMAYQQAKTTAPQG